MECGPVRPLRAVLIKGVPKFLTRRRPRGGMMVGVCRTAPLSSSRRRHEKRPPQSHGHARCCGLAQPPRDAPRCPSKVDVGAPRFAPTAVLDAAPARSLAMKGEGTRVSLRVSSRSTSSTLATAAGRRPLRTTSGRIGRPVADARNVREAAAVQHEPRFPRHGGGLTTGGLGSAERVNG
jgi:hypothetical protein